MSPSERLLRDRVDAAPGAVAAALRRAPPSLSVRARALTVTGAGIAEGAARFLVSLLPGRARFVPLSAFATRPRSGDCLVVFSQGLSPNARIALERTARFTETLLVTAADPSRDDPPGRAARGFVERGVRLLSHPPAAEEGMLLRIVGPAAAAATALRLADAIEGHDRSIDVEGLLAAMALARNHARVAPIDPKRRRVVMIGEGTNLAGMHGLPWKWLEGLWSDLPPLYDVLQFAHGPFQSLAKEPALIIGFEPPDPAFAELFDRLQKLLRPELHGFVRLKARSPWPLALFEWDAALNELLVRAVDGAGRDLSAWPGRGEDGPLYGLDRELFD